MGGPCHLQVCLDFEGGINGLTVNTVVTVKWTEISPSTVFYKIYLTWRDSDRHKIWIIDGIFTGLQSFIKLGSPTSCRCRCRRVSNRRCRGLCRRRGPRPPIRPVPTRRPHDHHHLQRHAVASSAKVGPVTDGMVNVPNTVGKASRIIIVRPHSFRRVPRTVRTLHRHGSIILGLAVVSPSRTRQTMSFITNNACTVSNRRRHVNRDVFLFAPGYIRIDAPSRCRRSIFVNRPRAVPVTKRVPPTPT